MGYDVVSPFVEKEVFTSDYEVEFTYVRSRIKHFLINFRIYRIKEISRFYSMKIIFLLLWNFYFTM